MSIELEDLKSKNNIYSFKNKINSLHLKAELRLISSDKKCQIQQKVISIMDQYIYEHKSVPGI